MQSIPKYAKMIDKTKKFYKKCIKLIWSDFTLVFFPFYFKLFLVVHSYKIAFNKIYWFISIINWVLYKTQYAMT